MRGKYYQSFIVAVFISLSTSRCFSQEKQALFKAHNAVYIELLGANHELYSINYDKIVSYSQRTGWLLGYRIGSSLLGRHLVKSRLLGEFYGLLGREKNHLELGLSSSLGRNSSYDWSPYGGPANLFISPIIAYRLQEPSGPSCFRVSISPFLKLRNQEGGSNTGVTIGISFGRSF